MINLYLDDIYQIGNTRLLKLKVGEVNTLDDVLLFVSKVAWKKGVNCALAKMGDTYYIAISEKDLEIPSEILDKSELIMNISVIRRDNVKS